MCEFPPHIYITALSLISECKGLNLKPSDCFTAFADSSSINISTKETKKYSNGPSILIKKTVTKSRFTSKTTWSAFAVSLFGFFRQPRLTHLALLRARWWNDYIKPRNRRARSFLLGTFLAAQWKNHFLEEQCHLCLLQKCENASNCGLHFAVEITAKMCRIMWKKKKRDIFCKCNVTQHWAPGREIVSTPGWLPGFTLNENLLIDIIK